MRIEEHEKAKEAFKALLRLKPSWRADPKFMAEPEMVVFEEALAEYAKEGWGSLRLHSQPMSAEIYLDEKPRLERTPATIEDLPAGVHHIRLTLDDYFSLDTLLTVEPSQATELNVTLEKQPGEKGGKPWWFWALGGGAIVVVAALLAGGGGGGGGGGGAEADLPNPPDPPSR